MHYLLENRVPRRACSLKGEGIGSGNYGRLCLANIHPGTITIRENGYREVGT
jgi:hypothetical protein